MAVEDDRDIPHRPEYLLTTYDNPYNPFTQWDEWYQWDAAAGYHTPGLLDRVALVGDEMADADLHHILQTAIDEIVRENVSGMHKKILATDVVSSDDDNDSKDVSDGQESESDSDEASEEEAET